MSLINDALQRAKQVQQAQPPAAGSSLQFRPVEPGPQRKKISMVAVFVVLGVILILGVVFISRLFPKTQAAPLPVRAATPHVAAPAAEIRPAPAKPATAVTPEKAIATTTNVPAAPIAKPPLPRLQAIVFSTTRPSAIINGRTLYVGNRIGAYRIAAIQPNSVTLVNGTETNVLQLGEE